VIGDNADQRKVAGRLNIRRIAHPCATRNIVPPRRKSVGFVAVGPEFLETVTAFGRCAG
jgi:hypothetical protein